jgi:nicotinate-nucleotide adenylyltransferase
MEPVLCPSAAMAFALENPAVHTMMRRCSLPVIPTGRLSSAMTETTPHKIGLYGGTFDPVHHGHLILGRDALEILGLDRLIFIPAAISPHKLASGPGATGEQRLAMLAAALADEDRFVLDDCELHRVGPSFTVDTVEHLRGRLPEGTELYYLIGEDNVAALDTWHRIDALCGMVRFVVFRREGRLASQPAPVASSAQSSSVPPPSTFCLLPSAFSSLPRLVDISSTEIRNRVASGQSIRYLVPEAVAGLIETRQLYRQPSRQKEHVPLQPKN